MFADHPLKFWGYEIGMLFKEVANLSNNVQLDGTPIRNDNNEVYRVNPILTFGINKSARGTEALGHGSFSLIFVDDDLEALNKVFSEFSSVMSGELPFEPAENGCMIISSSGSKFAFDIPLFSNGSAGIIVGQEDVKYDGGHEYPAGANHAKVSIITKDGNVEFTDIEFYSGTYSGLRLAHDFAVVCAIKSGMSDEEIRRKFLPLMQDLIDKDYDLLCIEENGVLSFKKIPKKSS